MILFKETVDKNTELLIRKTLEKYYSPVSVISKTSKTILDPAFDARESILFEAVSLLSKNSYCSKFGFIALGMFRYEFKKWSKLQKTKFYYALNGRRSLPGMIVQTQAIKLSDNLVFVPVGNIEHFKKFLESWNLEYRYIPMLLPQRLNRKDLLTRV